MSKRFFVAGVVLLLGVAIAVPAAAQESSKKKDDSYGYIFTDDPLRAEGIGATTAQIRVHKAGRRELLLRPRVHFVQEMLKSVENM
jgi:hypothetical protein